MPELTPRQLIEADKAYLRRLYPATAQGLADLKTAAAALHDGSPSNVTITAGNFEGGGGQGQVTGERHIRRAAIEELIAERDADFIAPPARPLGSVLVFEG